MESSRFDKFILKNMRKKMFCFSKACNMVEIKLTTILFAKVYRPRKSAFRGPPKYATR